MNDPGLDDAIAEEASVLDRPSGRQEDQGTAPTEDENQTRVDPQHPEAARWWLASTAYPLTAVCMGRSSAVIVVFDDPESHLHSRVLSVLWRALSISALWSSHGAWRFGMVQREMLVTQTGRHGYSPKQTN